MEARTAKGYKRWMLRAPAGAKVHEWEKGKLELWLAAPSVVVQRAHGHATLDMSRAISRNLDALVASGVRVTIFNDWETLESYSSEARIDLTRWTVEHRDSIQHIHVLLKSRLVAMGISVSALVTGRIITAYTDRRKFELELAAAVRTAPGSSPGTPR